MEKFMRDHHPLLTVKILFAILYVMLAADHAFAYIGPGPGLEFIGYFSSLAALMLAAFSAVLLWPFYALLRWLRGSKDSTSPSLSGVHPIVRPGESGLIRR
jgi:hypothetical protein